MAAFYESMHESVLKDYFLGLIDESQLNEDLEGSVIQTFHDVITHYVNPMDSDFQVELAHLVKLCDAVLSGKLKAEHLELIGYCLVASDQFFGTMNLNQGNWLPRQLMTGRVPKSIIRLRSGTLRNFGSGCL